MKYFILLILLVSCGGDNFRKVEKLDGFRVLGVKADLPEISQVGGNVDLNVLASDINGSGIIEGSYTECIDPGIGRGAEVKCNSAEKPYDIDFTGNPTRTGLGPTITIIVPGNVLIGRTELEKFNGVAYIVIFKFNVSGVETKIVKRIVVTDRGDLNSNPTADGILLNGVAIISNPVGGDKLNLFTNSIPENYQYLNVDGSQENKTETYEVAWYTSDGEFNKPKASINDTVEYTGDSPSTVTIGVLRDGRGGMDFIQGP